MHVTGAWELSLLARHRPKHSLCTWFWHDLQLVTSSCRGSASEHRSEEPGTEERSTALQGQAHRSRAAAWAHRLEADGTVASHLALRRCRCCS